ncbi:hypothetical protein [Aestuariivirga litoralis]|uniref:hypothetical protein n=1 Tax=Aestuariivirga litoralis TaxID=2650924 RepID=UPI0018C58CF9|nr:hypothetical protein [Aestuariivirga litoralis]MBG1231611.1 hypothetical protein [Aestuariivirga litoralis]
MPQGKTIIVAAHRQPGPEASLHPHEAAVYLADMTLQMMKIARTQGLKPLEDLFELAYYEAYSAAHPVDVSPEDFEEWQALQPKPTLRRKR